MFGASGETGLALAREGIARVEAVLARLGAPNSIAEYVDEGFSIGAAVCGVILFWDPDTIREIWDYLLAAWYRLPLLIAAAVAGYLFVFQYRKGVRGFDFFGRN